MSESGTEIRDAVDEDSYTSLLQWLYEGDVFGAAFLQKMLDEGVQAERCTNLQLLQGLEQRTRGELLPVLRRHGVEVDEPAAALRSAAALTEAVGRMSWTELLDETERVAVEALPRFRRPRERGSLPAAWRRLNGSRSRGCQRSRCSK